MRAKYPNENEQNENALDNLEHMDAQTIESLGLFKTSHDALYERQQAELKRLTVKYGPNHARVQKLQTQLVQRSNFSKALDLRMDLIKTQAEPLPEGAWRIQGYVSADNGDPLPGLTVTLGLQREKAADVSVAKSTGKNPVSTITNVAGWYSLTLSAEDLKALSQYPLYLVILDARKQILYTSKDRLTPTPNQIDFMDVMIKMPVEKEPGVKAAKKRKK